MRASRREEKRRLRNRGDPNTFQNQTPFRAAERRFAWAPAKFQNMEDKADVIDMHNLTEEASKKVTPHHLKKRDVLERVYKQLDIPQNEHLANVQDEDIVAFSVDSIPDLVLVKGLLDFNLQRLLIQKCLREYSTQPNVSSLDVHYDLPQDGLWNAVERGSEELIHLRSRAESNVNGEENAVGYPEDRQAQTEDNKQTSYPITPSTTPAPASKIVDASAAIFPDTRGQSRNRNTTSAKGTDNVDTTKVDASQTQSQHLKPSSAKQLLERLRWTTLGFQYNWVTKEYHFDRRYPMPELISKLTKGIVELTRDWTGYKEDYKPEAGIVNYYGIKDKLMAHQDRSEPNDVAPLVSISLGCDAIFLMGTDTKDDKPEALLLHSGDIVMMAGRCRRGYHSVPRIWEDTCPPELTTKACDLEGVGEDWRPFGEFMEKKRVNINTRQVF